MIEVRTKGPWTLTRHRDGSGGYLVCRGDVVIATTSGDAAYNEEANARLMAAAPDLLNALVSIVNAVKRIREVNGHRTVDKVFAEALPEMGAFMFEIEDVIMKVTCVRNRA